jgi:hypothetical protein
MYTHRGSDDLLVYSALLLCSCCLHWQRMKPLPTRTRIMEKHCEKGTHALLVLWLHMLKEQKQNQPHILAIHGVPSPFHAWTGPVSYQANISSILHVRTWSQFFSLIQPPGERIRTFQLYKTNQNKICSHIDACIHTISLQWPVWSLNKGSQAQLLRTWVHHFYCAGSATATTVAIVCAFAAALGSVLTPCCRFLLALPPTHHVKGFS